jgi:hypothetical protein
VPAIKGFFEHFNTLRGTLIEGGGFKVRGSINFAVSRFRSAFSLVLAEVLDLPIRISNSDRGTRVCQGQND